MKKIIILYINDLGGHSQAARNIKEALHYKDSQVMVLNINGFRYFYSYWEKIVDVIYTAVIKHTPFIWGRVYDRQKVVNNLLPIRKWVSRLAFKKIKRIVKEFEPTCFVATQAFPCGIIADFKEQFSLNIPLVAVVTDYYPHRFWIDEKVNKYIVACQVAKEILVSEGVMADKVKILGIPISVKFLHSYAKDEICHDLGFKNDLNTVVIMGGGLGLGPFERVAWELDEMDHDFQMIVICGHNKKLYKRFIKIKEKFKKPIFCFGYTEHVHKIMDFADIIITKGGGITVSESLAKGVALIIAHPIPGQEERNVRYLLDKNAVVKIDNEYQITDAVRDLLDNKKKMYSLKEHAKEISFIDSSLRVAELILAETEEDN